MAGLQTVSWLQPQRSDSASCISQVNECGGRCQYMEPIIHVSRFQVMTNCASAHIVQHTQLVVMCTHLRQQTRIMQHCRGNRSTHYLYSHRKSASSSTFPNGLAKLSRTNLKPVPIGSKGAGHTACIYRFRELIPLGGCMCRCTRTQSRHLEHC